MPSGALTNDGHDNFYGMTAFSGTPTSSLYAPSGPGTIFVYSKLPYASSYSLNTPATFDGTNGKTALDAPIFGPDGNLYGSTSDGGANGKGNIFKLTPDGTLTSLVDFNGANGASPFGRLLADSHGNLFGTTDAGGDSGNGTIFKIAPDGTLTTLFSFDGTDGANPQSVLIADSLGNLYGVTILGGAYNQGTIFELVAAPEPSSLALLTVTALILLPRKRRRRTPAA